LTGERGSGVEGLGTGVAEGAGGGGEGVGEGARGGFVADGVAGKAGGLGSEEEMAAEEDGGGEGLLGEGSASGAGDGGCRSPCCAFAGGDDLGTISASLQITVRQKMRTLHRESGEILRPAARTRD
jgi:hypothetical protein